MEYPQTTNGYPKTTTIVEEVKQPVKESRFKKVMHKIFVHNIGLKIAAIVLAVALFVLKAGLS